MKRHIRTTILAISLGTLFATSGSAQLLQRPEGKFSSFLGQLKYDPSSGCYKPMRPFTEDRFAWDSYKAAGERYLSCIRNAANSDMKYAEAVIKNGYEKAANDFLREVEFGY